jgi:hypothetical protein
VKIDSKLKKITTMKYLNNNTFLHVLFLLLSGFLYGCTVDDADTGVPDGQERMVSFSVRVPGAGSPSTYALTAQDENEVKTVEILLFDGDGKYTYQPIYSNRITTDENDNTKKTFKVKVPQGIYDMVILANSGESLASALGSISKGEAKASVLGKLLLTNNSKWNTISGSGGYIPIPMWGEIKNITVSDAMPANTNVSLARMIAKVDVSLSETAQTKFDLQSVRLYNYYDKGRIAPLEDEDHWDAAHTLALAPSVPAGAAKPSPAADNPLVYDRSAIIPEEGSGVSCTGEIYTFEAEKGSKDDLSNNTCLVIGGKYNGEGKETYYRVDFANTVSGTTTYLPLLRNHQYKVTISNVEGSGTASAKDAFNSRPVNIVASVMPWNDADISDIVFDGQYMLGVSQGELSFSREQRTEDSEDNIFKITTDYPKGWEMTGITENKDGTGSTIDWLDITPEKSETGGTMSTRLILDVNNTGSPRTGYIHLSAGRLNYTVKVVQTEKIYIRPGDGPLSITDSHGNPISELTFAAAAADVIPDQQTFTVSWPKDARLNYTVTVSGAPFTFGTGGALSDPTEGSFEPVGTGEKTYIIQPSAAIETSELESDPLYAKSTTITYTLVNSDYQVMAKKSLTIRQEVYNLTHNFETNYLLDGKSYTFNVRSNTGWRIKSVDQSPNGLLYLKPTDNLIAGTTGGYNTAEGTPVTFRVMPSTSLDGIVKVIFESTDNPESFEAKEVTLNMSKLDLTLSVTNSSGQAIEELVFASEAGTTPAAQTYKVNWTPQWVTLPFTITNGNPAFSFSTDGGNSDPTTTISPLAEELGLKSYTIQPASAIDPATFSTNPFPEEKLTTIRYNFTIEGIVLTSQEIKFKQVGYQLVHNAETEYYANGSSYSFRVRSNAAWEITNVAVSQPDLLASGEVDKLMETIGNDDGTGTLITFKTAQSAENGTVTLTFKSTNSPNQFDLGTIVLTLKNGYYPTSLKNWAGSNIYWDASKATLTFAEDGTTDKWEYQGVFFQWGSLYGLDPSYAASGKLNWATERRVFKPNADGSGYENTSGYTWGSWPQIGSVQPGGSSERAYLYEITNGSTGLGDICKYLTMIGSAPGSPAKRWRMPTSHDFNENFVGLGTSWETVNTSVNRNDGTWRWDANDAGAELYDATSKYGSRIYIPTAGFRASNGVLWYVGQEIRLWTGTAYNAQATSAESRVGTELRPNANRARTEAYSVRCVLE